MGLKKKIDGVKKMELTFESAKKAYSHSNLKKPKVTKCLGFRNVNGSTGPMVDLDPKPSQG